MRGSRNPESRGFAALLCVLGGFILAASHPLSLQASHRRVSFQELAQTADLIFIGTVAGRDCTTNGSAKMIFTHVHFSDVRVVHASGRSYQKSLGSIRLTHAGGKLKDRGVWVSVAPEFRLGGRYLVFMLDDGLIYANPVVGGPQGQFTVIQDKTTLQDYLLTPDGKAVLEAGSEGIVLSRRRAEFIHGGVAHYLDDEPQGSRQFFRQLPVSPGDDFASLGPEAASAQEETQPLPLDQFIEATLRMTAMTPQEGNRSILPAGQGKFYTRVGNQVVEMDLSAFSSKNPDPRVKADHPTGDDIPGAIEEWYDAELVACGYQSLFEVMEQVAVGRWDYDDNENALSIWNFTMDVFRYTPDDGYYGADNGEDEFVGFLSDAEAYAEYNFHWGGASGMTINWVDPGDVCDEIHESDVMFNAALSWTDDFLTHLGGGPEYYPDDVLHETGHVWGLMSGGIQPESYAYDHPTVMNAHTTDIVEDGRQVHVPDVNLMRRVYDGQTSVPSVKDLGVESYYALNGTHRSTTTGTHYYPGGSITISNITVENMSPTAQTDVRLRFFLSSDRTITTSDHLMGFYWSWPTFAKESYNHASYTTNVPYIHSGQYYVGAIVTVNGFAGDDAPENNATFLFDSITVYPMPPSNVQATDGTYNDRIRVTWDASTDTSITGYKVWRAASETGAKSLLGQVAGTSYDDLTPAGGWNYYWIQSVNALGTSLYSAYDTGYVGVTVPTGLSATDGTYTDHVALSWTAVTGASGYEVWRNTDLNTSTAGQIGTCTSASYNDTTAVPELMYYYWVKATNGIATSGFSSYDAGWRALAVPSNVQASDGTYSDKVRVTWNAVAYAGQYQVRRNTANNLSTATIISSAVYGTTYDDTTATPMQTYFYWVRAENGFGYSQFSPPDTGYRTTPVPQSAEVVGDFGGFGLWMRHGGAWSQLTGLNPDTFIFADADGDGHSEIFGDFGIFGLWLWNNDVWTHLSWSNADSIISGDVDADGRAELIGDFGAIGLWIWNGGDWMQLTGVNPESVAAADVDGDGDKDVVGDFGGFGVWIHVNYNWYPLAPLHADSLTAGNTDGDPSDEILGDFGSAGVWLYDNSNWTALTDLDAEALIMLDHDGDGVDEIIGDFGVQWVHPEFSGLWLWDGGALTHLNWNNAVTLIPANTDAHPDMEIVGTYLDVFGSVLGLWICDELSYAQLNPLNPETIAAGDIDADGIDEVIGDFGAFGLWSWDNGTWTLLAGANAENVGVANIK